LRGFPGRKIKGKRGEIGKYFMEVFKNPLEVKPEKIY